MLGAAGVAALTAVYEVRVVVAAPTQEVTAQARVPAVPLAEQSATRRVDGPATGAVGAGRATGQVTIEYRDTINVFGCDQRGDCPPAELVLPAGTRMGTCEDDFATPCPRFDVLFATQAALRLRIGTSAEVAVASLEPGTRGNVPAGSVESFVDPPRPRNAEVRILFSSETAGGTDAEEHVVTQADVDALVGEHEAAVRAQAERRLRAEADGEGLGVAAPVVEVAADANPAVGSATDRIAVTLQAVARGTGFDESRLDVEAAHALAAASPEGRFVVPDSVVLEAITVEGNEVVAAVRAKVSNVDPAAVRRAATRRLTSNVRDDLGRRYGAVELRGRPVLLPVGPLWGSRVDVRVESRQAGATP